MSAKTNQEVVDRCDVVFIGVLKQTEEVPENSNFRGTLLLLVSTLQWRCCTSGAPVPKDQIVRALLPVAKHRGACIMTPRHLHHQALRRAGHA